jgi:hypothetical protein
VYNTIGGGQQADVTVGNLSEMMFAKNAAFCVVCPVQHDAYILFAGSRCQIYSQINSIMNASVHSFEASRWRFKD